MTESRPRKRRWWIVAILLVLVAAGLGIWFAGKARDERRRVEAAAAAADLAHLKNVGLGHLENEEAAEAIEPFETIATRRPDLALGPRNLAVARLVELAGGTTPDEIGSGDADPALVAAANEAVEALRRVEPNSVFTAVIAARIAAASGDLDAARAALAAAAQTDPEAAWVRYERYRIDRHARTDELKQAATTALGEAYRLAPTNLWVTLEWLAALADRQDPAIIDVIEAAKAPLTPLAEGIAQRTRVNVLDLLDEAQAAARNGEWNTVSRNARVVANVVRPEEAAQSDQLRVNRNTLEFVAVDFPPEFYESVGLKRRPTTAATDVSFAPGMFGAESINAEGISDVVTADFDIDGRLDVAIVYEEGIEIASYEQNATRRFIGSTVPPGYASMLAADLDADADSGVPDAPDGRPCHDADPDVVLYGPAGLLVLENRRAEDRRSLVPVEQADSFAGIKNVLAAAFADFDLDGDLDLVASAESGITLWANVGDLKFEDRTPRADLPPKGFKPTAILPVDLDRDVDIDFVLAGGDGPAGYLENLRHGNLRWRESESAFAVRAVELIDADGNASWDLLAAGDEGVTLLTTQTVEPGRWTVSAAETVVEGAFDRLWQLDYDNDGLPDLLARAPEGTPVLLRNAGDRFEPTELLAGFAGPLVAADDGDLDNDGDLDLILASQTQVRLFENRGGNANAWIDVSLLAQQVKGSEPSRSGRVNHNGLGSLLELKAGPVYQPAIVRKAITHFGLGSAAKADVLRVVWTNGIPGNMLAPEPKQFLCEQQSLKGSCPYLYTFDGERFVFSTDLLWSAPIGLQFAEGVIAPCRPWEYLKLTTPLRPDASGNYVLQITEELWEAAYFDHVRLIAVDHPPGVEVFTNEKVGPPDLAAPRLHTVSKPRPPVAASDGHARDVLSLVAERDDRYVKAFDMKYAQGFCEPHALELDFGDLGDAERITLFLTGWVYPSDTSINVAVGQRSDWPKSKPPSLSVPNDAGEWVEVLPYTGFPGGKTKTIAIDLAGRFLCDDRRVRIGTNMELYWDAAFVTTDEPAVAVVTRDCPLVAADLHFRGVSAAVPHPQHGPERYDYSRVIVEQTWPPMRGGFTRYGDVTELLRAADDVQAVFAAGDEMTVRFAVPESPPSGWTRSFVLHNVGYDKDADLNTVYGQSSEPLPFQRMRSYPYAPVQSFPDSPAHRRFLDEYQTRTLPPRTFWTAVRDFDRGTHR